MDDEQIPAYSMRICVACGKAFVPSDRRQKYCWDPCEREGHEYHLAYRGKSVKLPPPTESIPVPPRGMNDLQIMEAEIHELVIKLRLLTVLESRLASLEKVIRHMALYVERLEGIDEARKIMGELPPAHEERKYRIKDPGRLSGKGSPREGKVRMGQ